MFCRTTQTWQLLKSFSKGILKSENVKSLKSHEFPVIPALGYFEYSLLKLFLILFMD